MSFGPVDPDLDLVALEEEILQTWRSERLFEQVQAHRRDGEPWVFYEGPPTANGRPGLHHVWARVFKDLYPRFETMRGRAVPRKGGWDCHGLPVELAVEKELGLRSKADIEQYGIAAFNERCRESVTRYVADWTSLTERSGVWIDTSEAYWTLDDTYVESVWWLVQQLWRKGLLYEGHRVSPYCPRCGTALSSHELGQPDVYQDVVDISAYVRLPLVDPDVEADLLVWTTTPWTLLSNTGAAVGADLDYVRVADPEGGRDLIVAEALAPEGAAVRERFKGSELVGRRYIRPFDLLEPPAEADGWRVVAAPWVSTDEGTGIVHLAPAFGADDHESAKQHGLPMLNPVTADGRFDDSAGRWSGRPAKGIDAEVVADLGERGLLWREQPYEHSYPHCWRCGTALIYWAKTSWFVRTSEHRDVMLEANEDVAWHPETIKHGRFGRWLEGNVDWALSRDRFWGTPLPVWRCGSCGSDTCIGSRAELGELAGRDLAELDLHRPHVDEIVLACACGGESRRLEPVLDAWFDSGSMPTAQQHWPFDDPAPGAKPPAYPADFICEGIDQTRGWFYSLLAIGSLVFGESPYRDVVCLALVVDESGQKMSKSKGNVIEPWDIFDTEGADALRWYFFSQGQPWTTRRVYGAGIRESARQTLLTLWNVVSFFATYADLDGWEAPELGAVVDDPSHVLDRWILSELDDAVAVVTEELASFDALAAATRIASFVDDLSNWYVRRSRPRFWKSSDGRAHLTLHECLVTVSRLLAPFCPFLADAVHRTLAGGRSVHLADWPEPAGRRDEQLAEQMASARRLVAIGRSARTDAKVKVRQPLAKALVLSRGPSLDPAVATEVALELNVHSLEDIDTLSGLMTWSLKPNFKVLGPRLGEKVAAVAAELAAADGSALKAQLDASGRIEVAGIELGVDDVEARAQRHEAYALAEDDGWAVALDLTLDDELRAEGAARELVRALNELRKERGLAIADRILLVLEAGDDLRPVLEQRSAWIAGEVLATKLQFGDVGDDAAALDLGGQQVRVTIAVDP